MTIKNRYIFLWIYEIFDSLSIEYLQRLMQRIPTIVFEYEKVTNKIRLVEQDIDCSNTW